MAWWRTFFDDDYARFGLRDIDPQLNQKIADFIVRTLDLKPGQTLFDQCCGIGRISIPMAERGIHVIGVDLTAAYVHAAHCEAQRRGLPCEFHQGDAFEFTAPEPCDAAINWFTSMGYGDDDSQSLRMLQRAFDSLRPGGGFLLDFPNGPKMWADFQRAIVHRPNSPDASGALVIQEQTPDFLRGMMKSDWTVIFPDGSQRTRPFEVRMFMPHDLVRLVRQAGFTDVQLLGWIDGEPFSRTSHRCIVSARKPA